MPLAKKVFIILAAIPVVFFLISIIVGFREAATFSQKSATLFAQMQAVKECINGFKEEHGSLPVALDTIQQRLTNRLSMPFREITNSFVYRLPNDTSGLSVPIVFQRLNRAYFLQAFVLESSGAIVKLDEQNGNYSSYLEKINAEQSLKDFLLHQ